MNKMFTVIDKLSTFYLLQALDCGHARALTLKGLDKEIDPRTYFPAAAIPYLASDIVLLRLQARILTRFFCMGKRIDNCKTGAHAIVYALCILLVKN